MLDSVLRVATPEGVELSLRLAGPVPRALAWLLDFAWRCAAMIALLICVAPFGRFGGGIALLGAFALEWLIPAWFEVRFGGATPGKKALHLMVLRDDGSPITWGPALTRNFLRFADFLPLLYAGGLVCMLFNRQFKRLGDLAAGTVVVYAEQRRDVHAIPSAEPAMPRVALTPEDRRTVLEFAERAPQLSSARAEELAQLAGRLLDGRSGAAAVAYLIALANHLHGPSAAETLHAPG